MSGRRASTWRPLNSCVISSFRTVLAPIVAAYRPVVLRAYCSHRAHAPAQLQLCCTPARPFDAHTQCLDIMLTAGIPGKRVQEPARIQSAEGGCRPRPQVRAARLDASKAKLFHNQPPVRTLPAGWFDRIPIKRSWGAKPTQKRSWVACSHQPQARSVIGAQSGGHLRSRTCTCGRRRRRLTAPVKFPAGRTALHQINVVELSRHP